MSTPPPLGFTVEDLLPAARVAGPLRMGLVKLPESAWLDPAPDHAARGRAFDAHPGSVIVMDEARAGEAELAALMGLDASDGGGIEACARSVHEDLCLITQPEKGGPFHLTAAAVAYPTDWRIAEKMGRPMHEVHEPIHGYAENLASGVDRFMDGLQSHNLFGRTNAFVLASDAYRYMPTEPPEARFAHVTAANAGETLFVRCERETLRRLPRSRAIVFTIGIYRAALGSLSDAAVARVAQSVAGFGEGEGARRAAPHYAEALAGYAEARLGAKAA